MIKFPRGHHFTILLSLTLLAPQLVGAVTGSVIDADGAAIAGASVRLLASNDVIGPRTGSDSAPEVLVESDSDAKGNYELEVGRSRTNLTLEISAQGYFPERIRVPHDAWIGATVLRRAPPVTGRVVSGSDGIPGATVTLLASTGTEIRAVTDDDGHFTVPEPGNRIRAFSVTHPEFAPLSGELRPVDDLDFRLEKGIRITGRAVGPDGETPVSGAAVVLDGWLGATTGEDGTFTIEHAPADWSEAWITKDDLVAAVRRSTAKSTTIQLRKGARVSGTVVDAASGRPVPDVVVSVMRRGPFGPQFGAGDAVASITSDASGRYSLAGLLPGTYILETSHPGWTGDSAEITVVGTDPVSRRVPLRETATIRGRAATESGDPVAAAFVVPKGDESRGRFRMRLGGSQESSARSAPDGRFVIFGVEPDQSVRLEGSHREFPATRTDSFAPEAGETVTGADVVFAPGMSLTGVVRSADDTPVSGASIRTSRTERGRSGLRMIRIGQDTSTLDPVVTDAKGRFSVQLEKGSWDLTVEAAGFAPARLNAIEVGETNEPLEITLEEGASIHGRVVRGGAGVPDVMVSVIANQQPREPIATGPDGRFTVEDLSRGNVTLIVAKPAEFIQEMRSVEVPAPDLTIEVPSGGTVRGRVVEAATNDPVTDFQAGPNPERGGGGMRVRLPGSLLPFHSDTGEFVLQNVPPGRTEIVIQAPGFLDQTVRGIEVADGETVDDVLVELSRGVRVSGTVRGPDGRPVAGVSVMIQQDEQSPFAGMIPGLGSDATTDSSGQYVIASAEPGERTFLFAKDGLAPTRKSVELSGQEATVDATLDAGRTVRGTVTTSTGAPVANAAVRAMSAAQGGRFDVVETGSSGEFTMDGLPDGRYTFTASHDDYVSGSQQDVDITSGQPVRLTLSAGGSITGRILGADQAAYSSITVRAQSAGMMSTSPVSPDGTFRLEGVNPGTASVVAQMRQMFDNRSTPPVSVEVTAGSTSTVDLEFSGGSTVSGTVTRFGEPLRSGLVRMSPADRSSGGATSNIDSDGNYTIDGLTPGSYELTVIDLQSFSPFSKTVDVRSDRQTIDIDMRGGRLTGRVTDAGSSQPVAEARVVLESADEEAGSRFSRLGATTASSGEFVIDPIPEGSYRLRVERSGYGHASRDVYVTEGREESVDISLQPTEGLSLRVVDRRDGRPLTAAIVAYDSNNQIAWEGRPSPRGDGEVRIPVAPGTYRVRVWAAGYAPSTVTASSPGSTQTVGLSVGGELVIESNSSERRRVRIIDPSGRPASSLWDPTSERWIEPGVNRFEHLEPGQYTIQILGANGSVVDSRSVVINEGQSTTISI